jgi:lambda repressor-like predicted transcriptional regulator
MINLMLNFEGEKIWPGRFEKKNLRGFLPYKTMLKIEKNNLS